MRSEIKTNLKLFDNAAHNFEMRSRGDFLGAALKGIDAFRDMCRDMPPSCPVKSGALYDAHEITAFQRGASTFIGKLSVTGIPYAVSQHEGISRHGTPYQKYTRPGSGPFWISSKIRIFLMLYGGTLSSLIGNALRHFK